MHEHTKTLQENEKNLFFLRKEKFKFSQTKATFLMLVASIYIKESNDK
jgi:hypothetical protein